MSELIKDDKYEVLNRTLDIPASGIVFASGGSLIGAAVGGPIGGMVAALIGAASGVITEVASQKLHKADSSKKKGE